MSDQLTIQQLEAPPSWSAAPVIAATGGNWGDGTYHIVPASCYHALGTETDLDSWGLDRSGFFTAWDGIVVAEGTGTAEITFVFDRPARDSKEMWDMHHFALFGQDAAVTGDAAFNFAKAAFKLGATADESTLSIVSDDDPNDGGLELTFGATGPSVIIGILRQLEISQWTPKARRLAFGQLGRIRHSNDRWVDAIRLILTYIDPDHSEFSRLMKWIASPTFVSVVEEEVVDAELDAPIKSYQGFLTGTDYANSPDKNERDAFFLDMLVETTTISAQVP